MNATNILIATGFCLQAIAQDRTICTPGPGKGAFSYEMRLEPPVPPLAGDVSRSLLCTDFGAHRAMSIPSQRKYFGYDIDIQPASQANTYRVTLKPLSVGPEQMGLADAIGWQMLPLPRPPTPQIMVRVGDKIMLDLFVNPVTGQKIVDYIRIEEPPNRGVSGKVSAEPPRDFTVADAELRLTTPHVSINGKAAAKFGDVSAVVIWFYLPHQGRYILSLVPHPEWGFQKAGEIRGRTLSFTIGADAVSLECADRVASEHVRYNLYVRHDAGWSPQGEIARSAAMIAAEESVAAILR